jgi:hypothetical protein
VSVKKVLAIVIGAVVVGVVLVGGTLAGSHSGMTATADGQGMMPVVTVTGEMPRLVMPTVEVVAVRTVAMSGSDLRVN